jgi:hypothetical protein
MLDADPKTLVCSLTTYLYYSFRASPGNVAEIEHLLYGENDVIRQGTLHLSLF